MPKMKTNRSAAKRVRKTGSGKMKRNRPYHRHILTKKPTKRKRHLRSPATLAKSDNAAARRMMPYA